MADLFHYDPVTGVREFFDYDEQDGTAYIRREQDVSPFIEAATAVRHSGISDAKAKKDDYFCLYAIIPPVVQMDLMNKGINIHDKNCTKRLLEEINTNYPYLKATEKIHVANS